MASIVAGLLAACATAERTTWEQDRAEGLHRVRPSPRTWTDRPDTAETPEVEEALGLRFDVVPSRPPVEEIAESLELAMLRFTSERRMLTTRISAGHPRIRKPGDAPDRGWPEPMRVLWGSLLLQLEQGLEIPPDVVMPRRVLLQARVTTEAERELTERRFGSAPPDIADRIIRVHGQVALLMRQSALAGDEGPRRSRPEGPPGLGWPVAPVIFTSFYGYRKDPIVGEIRFHTGVDLAGDRGDLVIAAGAGRVVHTGQTPGYGKTVVVQHVNGYQTLYAHLSSIIVPNGVEVDPGTPVGQVGSSGRSTGPHLHFEVRHGGVPIDPLRWIGMRVATLAKPRDSTN